MSRISRTTFTILGAGLMGRLLALALARDGHQVTVHEAGSPDAEGAAARVAAAMLAPLAESAITEPGVVRMGQYALERWPQLLAQLDAPVFFQRNGTLIVWHRQDAAEAARLQRQLKHNQQTVPELPALQTLEGVSLARQDPAMAGRFHQGVYLPGEGQLDNRQLLAALLTTLKRLGVTLHWNSPRAPEDFAPDAPGWLIDCRGLGARADWKPLHGEPSDASALRGGTSNTSALRGVRGEVVRVHAPEVTLQQPTRLVHPRYPIYIAPKQDHLFVIGATEIESDDLSPPSVRSTLELLSAAYAVHSGFAEARIVEIATQARPTLPDNLPAIRRTGPRRLQVNGLYRHGFMISPALLDATLDVIATGTTPHAAAWQLRIEEEVETPS